MLLKKRLTWTVSLVLVLLAAGVSAQEVAVLRTQQDQGAAAIKTQQDRMSYAVGVDLARKFEQQGIEADMAELVKGLRDGYAGEKLSIPEENLRSVVTAAQVELSRREEKVVKIPAAAAYGCGVATARNLKLQEIGVSVDLMAQGLRDASSHGKLLMTDEHLREAMAAFQVKLKLSWGKSKNRAKKYREAEERFLLENRKKEGVLILPNGLQYKVVKTGEGKKPTDADMVQVNYRGSFTDGTEFGSSYRDGQPITVKVKETIPGWRAALKQMPVGSKWQLFVLPQLVSRARDWGLAAWPIPTLLFDLELLGIN